MRTVTRIFSVALMMSFLAMIAPVSAITIVECEDSTGERSFSDKCPVGTKEVNAISLDAGRKNNPNTAINATVYVIPDCDTCEEVLEFFQFRGISVEKKFVHEDIEMQQELQTIAGKLSAPTTIIGEDVLVGYNRNRLMAALKANGYQEPSAVEEKDNIDAASSPSPRPDARLQTSDKIDTNPN